MGQLPAELLMQPLPQQTLQRRTPAPRLKEAPMALQMPKLICQKRSLVLQSKQQPCRLRYANMHFTSAWRVAFSI